MENFNSGLNKNANQPIQQKSILIPAYIQKEMLYAS